MKGYPISIHTIKQMNNNLNKSAEYFDAKKQLSCENVNFLLWGGLAAKKWSESKLKKYKN